MFFVKEICCKNDNSTKKTFPPHKNETIMTIIYDIQSRHSYLLDKKSKL